MTRESLAPLLRGIGTSLILAGMLIGFIVARRDIRAARLYRPGRTEAPLSREETDESVAERVVENLWFEALGFLGAAAVSSSFYVEYLARRKRGV
jgi:hypothetical protein